MIKQVNKILCCLLLVLVCFLGFSANRNLSFVYAVSNASEYTSVLSDLKTDKNFKLSNYQVDNQDYSLQVIQIAESVNDELFVYVYQPCSPNIDLQATSINISKVIDENLSYSNYGLKLVSFSGTLYKYKVVDFELEITETRYYDISSIFRAWNSNYDESPQNDNTISEVSFAVEKLYIAQTSSGKVVYNCLQTETVLITAKYIDSFRYWDGWYVILHEKVDRHFVAFSTDYDIDRLYEVDLIFTTKDYTATNVELLPFDLLTWEVDRTYDDIVEHNITLNYTQKANLSAHGIFGRSYTWDRIERVSDFLTENTNISDTAKQNIDNKQYVLSFYETYWVKTESPVSVVDGTEVCDVSLLRLKFEKNGIVYNLGVIDNKQSGDNIPSNYDQNLINISSNTSNLLKTILGILLLVAILILLAPFLPQIIAFIIWLIKGIWQVITAPFKAIKMSKKKKKTKKGGGKK